MNLPPLGPYTTATEVRLRVAIERAKLGQELTARLERLLSEFITVIEALGDEVTDTYEHWKGTQDGKSSPNTNG